MTVHLARPRAKRRWAVLGISVMILSLVGVAVVQAQLDRTLFELDKDATNDTTYTKVGVLNASVATATLPATTSIQICVRNVGDPPVPDSLEGDTVLIDAERMTLASEANVAGGGCPSAFPNKRSYTATRGADGTAAGAHSKAEDVSLITTGDFDGDDWDQVFAAVEADADTTCESLGAVECTFTSDGRAMSIFTQSKDYDEISHVLPTDTYPRWQWRDQSVPDADELDHGFAIKYIKGDGSQHLFFGADRFATNGTKDAGFWFFHDEVGTVLPVGTGDGTFNGLHTAPDDGGDGFCNEDANGVTPGTATSQTSPVPGCTYDDNDTGGDVLILTTFTGGGAVTTIRVFEWVGPAGSTAALLERGVASDCVPGDDDQVVCATVNDTTIETAWDYSGKSEPAVNQIASGGFLEGGVNLTDLGLEGCFSSFMATTRSSASLTADPKDFILGDFEACATEVVTTPKDGEGGALMADTDSDNLDEIEIGTDGTVAVKDSAVLEVKGTTTFTGSLSFYICGPFDNPDACDDAGVLVNTIDPVTANDTYVSDAATLTSVGRYCWFAFFDSETDGVPPASDGTIESPGDQEADPQVPYSTGECFEVTPVTPTLDTTAVTCEEVTNGETTVECTALSGPVDFGDEVFDEADLQGTADQPGSDGLNATYPTINPTVDGDAAAGTITFKLYGPLPTDPGEFDDQAAFDAAFETACDTLATGFSSGGITRTVDGDGLYNTFGSGFAPQEPGLYAWKAAYGGDPVNTTAAPLDSNGDPTQHNVDCDDASEDVTVRQIPTEIRTKQSWFPNDTAQIKSSIATDNLGAGGTVDFFLHESADCTGTPKYVERRALTGGTNSEEVGTSNWPGSTGVKTDGTTTVVPFSITTAYADSAASLSSSYSWKVVYTPAAGDTAHTGRQSACTTGSTETFRITYTNDNSGGTALP